MRIVVDKIYVFWEIPTHSMTHWYSKCTYKHNFKGKLLDYVCMPQATVDIVARV